MSNVKSLAKQTESRMELKRQATLLRICYSAFIELGETDLEGLAIKKVMARAEFAFNTFYNYFGDRETLMAHIMDEIVYPWREKFLQAQARSDDEAVKLGYLLRGWIAEFARDERFARFTMRNGAFHHRANAKSNRDAIDYFTSGAEKGLFLLSPVESKYLSLGLLGASAALILREGATSDLGATVTRRCLVMLGVSDARATEISQMPIAETESLDFLFQRRLEDLRARME
ncbi:MAG: hypothetical protein AAF434_16475 [Pseudomonadota bacterium]